MQLKTTLTLSTTNLDGHATDALVLIIAGTSLPDASNPAIAALAGDAIRMGDFAMKVGSAVTLPRPAGLKAARLMLVASGTSLAAARSAMNIAFGELKTRGVATASVLLSGFAPNLTESLAEQTVLAALDALYVYRETKPSAAPKAKLAQITLLIGKDEAKAAKAGLKRGHAIGAGIGLARECNNLPPNIATPAYLANQATALGRAHGLKVEVMDERAIEKLGMGSFLAVAKGSDTPAKFVVMRYQGAATNQAPLALIGKGITFDSGGISLKPGAGMDEMKFDMGGAASVLGTMLAVAELQPRINLVGIVVACENMPSGRALKPGDVVTSMSGQTIEILNTDAEGRLVLCDALTYAERFKPAAVIDVATLTGACVIALGDVRSGMYASDDDLAFALTLAGDAALDPCWRMPLDDEYAVGLKTNFADVANVAGREAGSVIAAKFLQRFASKYRWGHLDIAGTAWKSGAAKGGTGRPVGLLTHFILNQAKAS